MKIKLNLESLVEQGFNVRYNMIGDEKVVLICPYGFPTWTESNSIFRSSIWTLDGDPVSLSFRKFTNLGEQPLFEPLDESRPITYVEKKDGSTLIVSKYKGKLVVRTRGTIDATVLDNGNEIPFLIQKYPKAFDNFLVNSEEWTVIYEWETPSNFIVIRDVKEPTLTLTGAVYHHDYSYMQQDELNAVGKDISVPRPTLYSFPNLITACNEVVGWLGKEGIIVVDYTGQIFKKVKADDYKKKHAFKSDMSIKNLRSLYFQWGEPDFEAFKLKVEQEYDFECMEMSEPVVKALSAAAVEMYKQIADAKAFVQPLIGLERKEAAMKILAHYNKSMVSGFCFKFLDGKDLDVKSKEKLLEHILPNNTLDVSFFAANIDI